MKIKVQMIKYTYPLIAPTCHCPLPSLGSGNFCFYQVSLHFPQCCSCKRLTFCVLVSSLYFINTMCYDGLCEFYNMVESQSHSCLRPNLLTHQSNHKTVKSAFYRLPQHGSKQMSSGVGNWQIISAGFLVKLIGWICAL